MNDNQTFDADWDLPPGEPCWRCQSCGHKDGKKPVPADRDKYYRNPKPAKCPSCKSTDMVPEGL